MNLFTKLNNEEAYKKLFEEQKQVVMEMDQLNYMSIFPLEILSNIYPHVIPCSNAQCDRSKSMIEKLNENSYTKKSLQNI
jgi:hypothetical protein